MLWGVIENWQEVFVKLRGKNPYQSTKNPSIFFFSVFTSAEVHSEEGTVSLENYILVHSICLKLSLGRLLGPIFTNFWEDSSFVQWDKNLSGN